MRGRLFLQECLELGLLLRVEQPLRRPRRPVLGHPYRVVGVEAVRRDRRRIDEPLDAGRGGRAEDVEGALDVDGAGGLLVAADDQEGEVYDDVGAGEGFLQRRLVPDVAAAVLHLRPAMLAGVERPAGDAHDLADALVVLQQRHEPEAEGSGRAGHGNGEVSSFRGHAPLHTTRAGATHTRHASAVSCDAPSRSACRGRALRKRSASESRVWRPASTLRSPRRRWWSRSPWRWSWSVPVAGPVTVPGRRGGSSPPW